MADVNTQIFRQMDLFWGMNDQELALFREIASIEKYSTGEVIFHEGDECNKLYIVITGAVEISTLLTDGSSRVLGLISRGTQFGEMALIDDVPRAATAKAIGDTALLSVLRDDFLDLIEQHPIFSAKALINLARTLSQHLRSTNEALRQTLDWNLKISGAADLNLGKLIQNNRQLTLRLHDNQEVRGTLLQVEPSALGNELIIEDETGQVYIIPARSIIYIAIQPEETTLPSQWQ